MTTKKLTSVTPQDRELQAGALWATMLLPPDSKEHKTRREIEPEMGKLGYMWCQDCFAFVSATTHRCPSPF